MATPFISPMVPVPRNQGIQVPGLLPMANWVDCIVLTAGVAGSYTLPTDAQSPAQKGMILRLTSNSGPVYLNFNGAAAVATAKTDGTSSVMLHTDLESLFIVAPSFSQTLSLICASNAIVTIEVWR